MISLSPCNVSTSPCCVGVSGMEFLEVVGVLPRSKGPPDVYTQGSTNISWCSLSVCSSFLVSILPVLHYPRPLTDRSFPSRWSYIDSRTYFFIPTNIRSADLYRHAFPQSPCQLRPHSQHCFSSPIHSPLVKTSSWIAERSLL